MLLYAPTRLLPAPAVCLCPSVPVVRGCAVPVPLLLRLLAPEVDRYE